MLEKCLSISELGVKNVLVNFRLHNTVQVQYTCSSIFAYTTQYKFSTLSTSDVEWVPID